MKLCSHYPFGTYLDVCLKSLSPFGFSTKQKVSILKIQEGSVRVYRAYRLWRTLLGRQIRYLARRRQNQAIIESRRGDYTLADFDRMGVIFVHVPKTGGVSVSRSLFGHLGGGHRTVESYLELFGPWRFHRYFKFAFVRDPFSRLDSAFRFLKSGGYGPSDEKWAEEHLAAYPDLETFCCEWLNPINAQKINHFRPQVDFLLDRHGVLRIDFLGRFERLEEDFRRVCGILRVEKDLFRLNKTRSDVRLPKTRPSQLSRTARAKVIEVYREDFDVFGYSPYGGDVEL